MNAFVLLALISYTAVNLFTASNYSADEMYNKFVDGQCVIGAICSNIFYAPAWFLKGLRLLVLLIVK